MNDLEHYRKAFSSVGWFIPPYVTLGFLSQLAKTIGDAGGAFDQSDLERLLTPLHQPEHLAAMVTDRYSQAPFVSDYQTIISETIEAHFMGLHHVAVAGLMPVIEGTAKKLAASRSVSAQSMTSLFVNLATDCRNDVLAKPRGAVGEIVSMLDSFIDYASGHLYSQSASYPFTDKTNRHGILHGAYADKDYGQPLNFYKAISAVDVLCFLTALSGAKVSWLAPSQTPASTALAGHYRHCISLAAARPKRE